MKNNEKVRVCKKCKKILPKGYKHKCCEACRNKQADGLKKAGKVAGAVASLAVIIVTGGKINPKK